MSKYGENKIQNIKKKKYRVEMCPNNLKIDQQKFLYQNLHGK